MPALSDGKFGSEKVCSAVVLRVSQNKSGVFSSMISPPCVKITQSAMFLAKHVRVARGMVMPSRANSTITSGFLFPADDLALQVAADRHASPPGTQQTATLAER